MLLVFSLCLTGSKVHFNPFLVWEGIAEKPETFEPLLLKNWI
jgi:hypothetical protein